MPGQVVSADLHLVRPFAEGVLLAVVDGLGHGKEATAAASMAIGVLERHATEPVDALFTRCHVALAKSRGVVMTLASLRSRDNRVTRLGVGNVESVLLRVTAKTSAEWGVLRGGVVGYHLPELQVTVTSIAPGDLLVFATDGIGAGFTEGWSRVDPPEQIARRIVERHFKGTDDALVLVVRYLGAAP